MTRDQQGVILFLGLFLGLWFFLTSPLSGWRNSALPLREGRAPSPLPESEIMVEADGDVNQRGVIKADTGSTLLHVLERAGGIKGDLSIAPEDLGRKIEKSSRLRVIRGADGAGKISLEPLAAPEYKILSIPIPLNTASLEDLDTLPGIGPKTARAIIEYRETNGRFSSPDDLLNVPGIGPKKLSAIKPHISLK